MINYQQPHAQTLSASKAKSAPHFFVNVSHTKRRRVYVNLTEKLKTGPLTIEANGFFMHSLPLFGSMCGLNSIPIEAQLPVQLSVLTAKF